MIKLLPSTAGKGINHHFLLPPVLKHLAGCILTSASLWGEEILKNVAYVESYF